MLRLSAVDKFGRVQLSLRSTYCTVQYNTINLAARHTCREHDEAEG